MQRLLTTVLCVTLSAGSAAASDDALPRGPRATLGAPAAADSLRHVPDPGAFGAIETKGGPDDAPDASLKPGKFSVVGVNAALLEAQLAQAPHELEDAAKTTAVELELPMPGGGLERFRVVESPILSPADQAATPEFRTYRAVGIDDPSATGRLDFSPLGFHAMVTSDRGTAYVDPYRGGETGRCVVYDKRALVLDEVFECLAQGSGEAEARELEAKASGGVSTIDTGAFLRKYVIVVACTYEYAQAHGGTKNSAFLAIGTTINRVNEIFRRDLAIELTLKRVDDLLFTSVDDGYTNGNPNKMQFENETKFLETLSPNEYDIGHVFGTGTNKGAAENQAVCDDFEKSNAATCHTTSTGDAFDVDFVAHEIGHQFGADHTFNSTSGTCGFPGQRHASTAFEPGSGSTIMGYAGLCSPDNIQAHGSDYFHTASIDQIQTYVNSTTCGTKVATGNAAPGVTTPASMTIPRSTPFSLAATATDAANQFLTYCWEQIDNPASGGPRFRSMPPSSSSSRTFPQGSALWANILDSRWEPLPTANKVMKFRAPCATGSAA
jgi:hypothetical protein